MTFYKLLLVYRLECLINSLYKFVLFTVIFNKSICKSNNSLNPIFYKMNLIFFAQIILSKRGLTARKAKKEERIYLFSINNNIEINIIIIIKLVKKIFFIKPSYIFKSNMISNLRMVAKPRLIVMFDYTKITKKNIVCYKV